MIIVFGQGALHLKEKLEGSEPSLQYETKYFPDGEIAFHYEGNLNDKTVNIIQSISCAVNDRLIELLIMIEALKSGGASKINVVLTYFAYSRQDRVTNLCSAISAKVIANMISNSGISKLTLTDLHSCQNLDLFNVPVRHISLMPLFSSFLLKNFSLKDLIIISPDKGGIDRAKYVAHLTNLPCLLIDKKRNSLGSIDSMEFIGDVQGKECIIIDDIIDSGNTLVKAAKLLKSAGAKKVYAFATHAVFSENIWKNLDDESIDCVYVTDTIFHTKIHEKVKILSVCDCLKKEIDDIQ